jgi:hypothetical protein
MRKTHTTNQLTFLVQGLALVFVLGCLFGATRAEARPQQSTGAARHDENAPTIETDSDLPETYPNTRYMVLLQARGGLPPYHWSLERGTLPAGIQLDDHGVLHGKTSYGGEYQFTALVRDESGHRTRKQFVIRVRSALTLNWKNPARVNDNRIDGSVEVSNMTADDIDLTFVVMAVASNGRATAIGYQHFVLPSGTTEKELPFGDTLPRGGYVVHVDTIGEVAPKKLIYRERLQTPGALQVTVGP